MNRLSILLLLFADDLALFTTDKHSLQAQSYSIHLYSTRWGFTINVAKTKMCVLEKRKERHSFEWFINNENEEVSRSTYLRFAVKGLNEQALWTFDTLLFLSI